MKLLRWTLLIVALVGGGALAFYAWPFLTYPVTELDIDLSAPRDAGEVAVPVAGVAETDITPPIGMPKFGYSSFALDSDGFRTRLRARAFYLHGPGQTPLALVQLDLGAGSLPLHHRVAELIAARTDVPAHALSLLVTHTHSGPANYLGSDFYNAFGANRPGFDPKLFEFLSQRIADAVVAAYEQRRPARLALGQSDAWGLTRNRSVQAWARNFDLPGEEIDAALELRAVNPRLTMLRIDLEGDDGCFHPAGALSTFSIHGTAIPAFTGPWHGDVWTAASAVLERNVNAMPPTQGCGPSPFRFVHGAAQATHGDNNPNFVNAWRGNREAHRIGAALGETGAELFHALAPRLEARLETAVASRELDLLGLDDGARFGLCERAVVGASVAGAANDDEVFPVAYLPFLEQGWPRRFFTDGCQGVKQWMTSKVQLLLPAERFPHRALFQVIRVNDLVLVPLPWEVTLESGNRIREQVRGHLPLGDWTIEISSLANGYFGYAVTPEEYEVQYYEGGHTLYGPATQPFLAAQSARLTADLVAGGEVDDIAEKASFSLLSRQYWPEDAAPARSVREELDAPVFVPATEEEEAHWRWLYSDLLPGALDVSRPLLGVVNGAGETVADEEEDVLQLLLRERRGDHAVYEVRWYPRRWPADTESLQFAVEAREGQPPLRSGTF